MNSSVAPPGPRVRNLLIRIWPAAGSTVIVAGLLVTFVLPLVAEALISAEPVARPVTVPVAEPLPEVALTESTVAVLLSFEAKRSEEHTSELQSHSDLVCRLLLEKKK